MRGQSRQPIGNIPSCAASPGSLSGIYHHARPVQAAYWEYTIIRGQSREPIGNIPSCAASPGNLLEIYHHARPVQAAYWEYTIMRGQFRQPIGNISSCTAGMQAGPKEREVGESGELDTG
eukprot:1188653-Prorocentrum_minimum.AAC.2